MFPVGTAWRLPTISDHTFLFLPQVLPFVITVCFFCCLTTPSAPKQLVLPLVLPIILPLVLHIILPLVLPLDLPLVLPLVLSLVLPLVLPLVFYL